MFRVLRLALALPFLISAGPRLAWAAPSCPSPQEAVLQELRTRFEAELAVGLRALEVISDARLPVTRKEKSSLAIVLGKKPPSRWKESAAACASDPSPAVCAISRIYQAQGSSQKDGNEAAYRLLLMPTYSGASATLSQDPMVQFAGPLPEEFWTNQELVSIEDTLRRFPRKFIYNKSLWEIARFPAGLTMTVSGVNAAGVAHGGFGRITLHGGSLAGSDSWTLAHEIGHFWDYDLGHSSRVGGTFAALSAWFKRSDSVFVHSPAALFPTDYAGTDPVEDYAESFGSFAIVPELLFTAAPDKFRYMKDQVFDGEIPSAPEDDPRLTELLRSQGGEAALVMSCFENLEKLQAAMNGRSYSIGFNYRPTPHSSVGSGSGGPSPDATGFLKNSECLRKAIPPLVALYTQRYPAEFCASGGESVIAARLSARAARLLNSILYQLARVSSQDRAVLKRAVMSAFELPLAPPTSTADRESIWSRLEPILH